MKDVDARGNRRAEATPSFGRLCPAMTNKSTICALTLKISMHFRSYSQPLDQVFSFTLCLILGALIG
jgi:hypothetical protein